MEHKKIGGGIIAIDRKTGDLLLGRRNFDSKSPNSFAPFGGTFEIKDSNPKNTAKREFKEETGCHAEYEVSKTPFAVQDTPSVIFYSFIGVFDDKFSVHLTNEHVAYGWYQIDALPTNLHPGFAELIRDKGEELKSIINIVTNNEN